MTHNSNNELQVKAQKMIEEYGDKAAEVARRKVDAFAKNEHCREKDSALMLLTEVEKLLELKD